MQHASSPISTAPAVDPAMMDLRALGLLSQWSEGKDKVTVNTFSLEDAWFCVAISQMVAVRVGRMTCSQWVWELSLQPSFEPAKITPAD